jgi:hypothetical protein
MSCGTAPVHGHSDRASAPSRSLPPRGRIDLPERIRYLLTDRLGRGIGRGLGFPIAMTCRVSINASCKRICLKWVHSLPNWVVRDISGSCPIATEKTDIRRRSYVGRAALKAGVSPDFRNQMHLKGLIWHRRLFPGATGDRERRARLTLGDLHMPQSHIAYPGLIEIERPPCPKCHGPMMLTGVVSRPDCLDVRTFECSLCNCTEKVIVEIG